MSKAFLAIVKLQLNYRLYRKTNHQTQLNFIQFWLILLPNTQNKLQNSSNSIDDDSFQFTPDQITYLLPYHRQSYGAGLAFKLLKLLLLQTPTPTSQDRLTASADDRRECSCIT